MDSQSAVSPAHTCSHCQRLVLRIEAFGVSDVNWGHFKAGIEDGCLLFQKINSLWSPKTQYRSLDGVKVEHLIVLLEMDYYSHIFKVRLWDNKRIHTINTAGVSIFVTAAAGKFMVLLFCLMSELTIT
jgi:hypothetical protein